MDEKFNYKEAYRTIETKLVTRIKGSPKKIMITSCEEDAGKTTTATNLAITIAQSGKKVLLIDCDIKNPNIADQFGLPKFSSGLVDYLTEKSDTPNIYKPIKLSDNTNLIMNIDIIPTGVFTNISGEILASERMNDLLSNLAYYDFVILDTPPITRLSDALSLGRLVKDTLLVVRAGQTVKQSISWAVGELRSADINFTGLVVNDAEVKKSSYKYQYGYQKNIITIIKSIGLMRIVEDNLLFAKSKRNSSHEDFIEDEYPRFNNNKLRSKKDDKVWQNLTI